jgi:hypothetical protein
MKDKNGHELNVGDYVKYTDGKIIYGKILKFDSIFSSPGPVSICELEHGKRVDLDGAEFTTKEEVLINRLEQ